MISFGKVVSLSTKKCRVCNLEKDEEEFYRNSTRCRNCDREYLRSWERLNPDKTQRYWKTSYDRNKESIQAGCRRWEITHPVEVIMLQHRRRALLHSAFIEDVRIDILYARDDGICKICNQPCGYQDATIDHVLPLSLGGEHSYMNTQLAHLICNCKKRNKI